MKVLFKNLSKTNIRFSTLFWQLFFGVLPFTLIISVMAYTGQKTAELNGEYFQGISGALISLIAHPIVIFIGSIMIWTVLSIGKNLLKLFFT
ncbi:hypothetical protein [Sphingobacterium detergens]|uniref:Uncharacterized protein n=1 Tax=Sphingobacterium detergens TaxID=1145106 RepID=A0A420BKQ1_SPHD1|nr:hypothetical protein [Sphingobacterium detergens]RKE57293.1 hypothetical protein DFQ12_2180 [Sphingobacterium detergens]